jgi:hypothetical protein
MTIPIPTPDPMPLPAPVWLLRALLLLTFFLHLVVMNFAFGGSIIAVVSAIRSGRDEHASRLAKQLRGLLTIMVAFTITLGVAALLFVQVLYGPMLYSSSILLGTPWIAIIPLLIVGYYAFYWASSHASLRGLLLGTTILTAVAFIFSNNMSLMVTPERWMDLYRASPAGLHSNLGDTSLLPRYLHMALGVVAVGGLLVVVLGWREADAEHARWLRQQGGMWFTGATIFNILVGFWFLTALPRNVAMVFLGGSGFATATLGLGILLAIGAVVHLLLAANARNPLRSGVIAIVSAVATVALMTLVRDRLRTELLAPYFRTADLPVAPQWGVIVLFLVLFVAGLIAVYWMLRQLAMARRKTTDDTVITATV